MALAMPAGGQVPDPGMTIERSAAAAPGWSRAADGSARFGLAGIVVPAGIGRYRLVNVTDGNGGFDGSASYRGEGEDAEAAITLWLTQPSRGEPALTFAAARDTMERRFAGTMPTRVTAVPLGNGGSVLVAHRTINLRGTDETDLMAMSVTEGGWQLKLRLTAPRSEADALAEVRLLLDTLEGAGRLLGSPIPAYSACPPHEVAGDARRRLPRRGDMLAANLASVLMLGSATFPMTGAPRCALGEVPANMVPMKLYRGLAQEPTDYVATVGDSGITMTLTPSPLDNGKTAWFMLNLPDQWVLLDSLAAPVDDSDFRRLVQLFADGAARPLMVVERRVTAPNND